MNPLYTVRFPREGEKAPVRGVSERARRDEAQCVESALQHSRLPERPTALRKRLDYILDTRRLLLRSGKFPESSWLNRPILIRPVRIFRRHILR